MPVRQATIARDPEAARRRIVALAREAEELERAGRQDDADAIWERHRWA